MRIDYLSDCDFFDEGSRDRGGTYPSLRWKSTIKDGPAGRLLAQGPTIAAPASMLKKVKARIRRRKVKKFVKKHAGEILLGVAMGLLTDILTDLTQEHLRKKIVKKFR